MTTPQDLDSEFDQRGGGGTGAPSYDFPTEIQRGKIVPVVGHVVQGQIVDIFATWVKDAQTSELKLDKNGQKQRQINFTLQTEFRNWERAKSPGKDEDGKELPASEDTGLRRVYAKYRMLDAAAGAVRKSPQGRGAPKIGGHLAFRVKDLIWDEKNKTRNPLPDYEAKYEPPSELDNAFDKAGPPAEQSAPTESAPQNDPPVTADGKPW